VANWGNQPQPGTTRRVNRLFNTLIDLIACHFHNFPYQTSTLLALESMTWQQCKNMLLILGNVAKMLAVKSESACSLTLAPGSPTFSRELLGQIHND
jgi:hypothetical protein